MTTLDEEVDMASYADRLKALHADLNLFNRVKFYICDLLEFYDDGGALVRHVLQDPAPKFYMSSAYFTPEQVDFLISFKGRDGRRLEEALQSHIAPKIERSRNSSTAMSEIHPKFFMTSDYFTPEQIDFLVSFEGIEKLALEKAIQSYVASRKARSRNASKPTYEICTVHDFAPVVQDLFGVEKDFLIDFGFKCLFNKFAMKRSD